MPEPLSADDVRHVARLARLRLAPEQVEAYRSQLSTVLDHLAALAAIDVGGVEPLAHPSDVTNRLEADEPRPGLTAAHLHANAPAVEGLFLSVPKVLDADA